MKKLLSAAIFAVILLMTSCAPKFSSAEIFAMDTVMKLTAYGANADAALEKAEESINSLDKTLSVHDEDGELFKLNREGEASLSEDAYEVVKSSLKYCEETDGCFNPALFPVMDLWGFTDKNYRVPTEGELKKALSLAKPESISLNDANRRGRLNLKGMALDMGGIAKGYASLKAIEVLRESCVENAIVNLGGNVHTLGTKPDGSLWKVAVENPDGDGYLAVVEVADKAVITSGDYERNFTKNGKIYHHIIDPSTGKPAESGLRSVTVVSNDSVRADALSTALFVMGVDKATDYWRNNSGFELVLYTADKKMLVTEGLQDSLSSELSYDIVKK